MATDKHGRVSVEAVDVLEGVLVVVVKGVDKSEDVCLVVLSLVCVGG